jgi:hypothetical protein
LVNRQKQKGGIGVDKRFEGMDYSINKRFDAVDKRFDKVDKRLVRLETLLTDNDRSRIEKLEQDLGQLKKDLLLV